MKKRTTKKRASATIKSQHNNDDGTVRLGFDAPHGKRVGDVIPFPDHKVVVVRVHNLLALTVKELKQEEAPQRPPLAQRIKAAVNVIRWKAPKAEEKQA